MSKPKKTFLVLALAASIGVIYYGAQYNNENGWASIVAIGDSSEHQDGEFYITPARTSVNQTETATFNSYSQVTTQAVPVAATWTLTEQSSDDSDEGDDEAFIPRAYAAMRTEYQGELLTNELLFNVLQKNSISVENSLKNEVNRAPNSFILRDCENSTSCSVTVGNKPGKFTVTATKGDQTATATLTVKATVRQNPFHDKIPEWAEEAALMLESNNIMRGYDDGNFGPEDPVTRGQLALLMYRIMTEYSGVPIADMAGRNCNIFSDVTFGNYAYDAICFGAYHNWFLANDGGQFKPEEGLTRREVAQIIYNVVGRAIIQNPDLAFHTLNDNALDIISTVFADVPANDRAQTEIGAMFLLGFMKGSDSVNGLEFHPNDVVNRGETAAVLWRVLQKLSQ